MQGLSGARPGLTRWENRKSNSHQWQSASMRRPERHADVRLGGPMPRITTELLILDPEWTLPGRQRLQEDTQSQRQKPATRIDRKKGDRRRSPLRQQPNKLAFGDVFVAVRQR